MTYARNYIKLTFGGTLAGGGDIWSCGFSLGTDTDATIESITEDLPSVGGIIGTLIQSWFSNSGNHVPSDVKLVSVKAAAINTDGKQTTPAWEAEFLASGGTNFPYLPQGATVRTLVSSKFKDPGKYNRFYLPVAIDNTFETWKISNGVATSMATLTAQLIDDINTSLAEAGPFNNTYEVCVVSNKGTGYQYPVASVRVGNIVDTQRRRRNALTETYQSVNV